jgi:hypothetical protein
MNQAAQEIKRLGFDALIVDTFTVFARLKGTEENDVGPVADMRVLRAVAQHYDIGVVLIRHSGKDGTPRGSSAFEAEADICVTLAMPEGHHGPTVRRLKGKGRYGMWERNVELRDGRFVSLGSDDKVEFNKAVRFIKATLPESPEEGMKKSDILDARIGADADPSASTIDRALRCLVQKGDVGEMQLMRQRGKPKVYWLAYKPPEGVTTRPLATQQREFGGNESADADQQEGVYSNQTPTLANGIGENKPKPDKRHSPARPAPEQTDACLHGIASGVGCYLCDPTHPYRTGAS